jgi:hypothetical protein
VFALHEFHRRHFADLDRIAGSGALEVDVALGDKVEPEIAPVPSHISHGMRFGKHRFVEGLRELLKVRERRQIIDVDARVPALAQIAASDEVDLRAAGSRGIGLARFDSRYSQVEVRIRVDLASKLGVMRKARFGIEQAAIRQIVAAVDRPVISASEHLSMQRTVADVGDQKSALARLLLE